VLFVVDRVAAGSLGSDVSAPLVTSHRSRQEKPPWREQSSLRGTVEAQFLRATLLGESVVPYRVASSLTSVCPVDAGGMPISAARAMAEGYVHLARWLGDVERAWAQGGGKGSIIERLDYHRQLSAQFPIAPLRVLYSASGTLPAAAVLRDSEAVIEHKLYWAPIADEAEALYLAAILNSETARSRVAHMQSKGQWGARDFDKVIFELLIPKFDPGESVHSDLSALAGRAEKIAAQVDLGGVGFVAARGRVREALREDGVAAEIDALVAKLLDG